MTPVRYTLRSYKDLEDIEAYSLENWGQYGAIRYLKRMQAIISLLETSPDLGRDIGHLESECRVLKAEHHYVIYKHHHSEVQILRILSDKMDLARNI